MSMTGFRGGIDGFIDWVYNRQRAHATLQYVSSVDYESLSNVALLNTGKPGLAHTVPDLHLTQGVQSSGLHPLGETLNQGQGAVQLCHPNLKVRKWKQ
jgi:hypothetical protein